jgi:predicted TPR repeat methyltransferase/predicted negative regulator of RcsB-dependent stress response
MVEDLSDVTHLYRGGRLDEAEAACLDLTSQNPGNHTGWHLLGVVRFSKFEYETARQNLQFAIDLAEPDVPAAYYGDLGNALHKLRRLDAAETALRHAVEADPTLAAAQSNLGVVLTEQDRIEEAVIPLTKSVALAPEAAEPKINLAIALRSAGSTISAETSLREALQITPKSPIARSTLGLALKDMGRLDEAEIACCQALAEALDYAPGYVNLGDVLLARAKPTEAKDSYQAAIELAPDSAAAHSGLANTLRHLGDFDAAIEPALEAVTLAPNRAEAHYNLGLVYWESGLGVKALPSFQRALEIDPSLERALFLVATLSGQSVDTVPRAFVQAMFDTHAGRFDTNLVDELNYRIPSEIRDAVRDIWGDPEDPTWNIIDIGCGTGLCGALFRDAAKKLIGCDLSPNMIEKARERACYDELRAEDLARTPFRAKADIDLILATDVLIYLGDLSETFGGARAALRPGGSFGFTTEHETGDTFTLQTSGRFSHSESYVRELAEAQGFTVLRADPTVIRKIAKDSDSGIDGRLYVLQFGE